MGGSKKRTVDTVTAIITTALAGKTGAEIATTALSPTINQKIKELTTDKNGNVDIVSNTIAHTVWGAIEAASANGNATSGAIAAASAELVAPMLAKALYGKDNVSQLSSEEKQNILTLSSMTGSITATVTGSNAGNSVENLTNASQGAEIGKRAVENNYLQSDKDREKGFLEWKEKHKGLTEEEQHRKAELTEEDLTNNEALSNACRNVSSSECLTERKKAFAAAGTYKPQSIYNPVKDQAGYTDIERRLAETTPEVDTLRQIYNGYVQSFMQWGMSEENAKVAAGRRIGSEFILNGVVGAVALPKFGKALDSVGKVSNKPIEKINSKLTHFERVSNPHSPYLEVDKSGNEIYYRTLSKKDYEYLLDTDHIPPTAETFISPLSEYSSKYDGVLVRFYTKPGTSLSLEDIGVVGNSYTKKYIYPNMDRANKGWGNENALFKLEAKGNLDINNGYGVVNMGLGRGEALYRFNENIINFEKVNK